MSTSSTCDACGMALANPAAPCPRCLLRLGERPPSAAPPPPVPASEIDMGEVAGLFPDLEFEQVIGRGGMGVVYRARQKVSGRVIALKVLAEECTREPAFEERFEREARVLASLDHPNVVRFFNAGSTGGRFWLMMEYVEGVDLRKLMRTQEVSPRESLNIVGRICDALQYAHDAGVVHRDIKPENILIDRAGTVKIADFGLAKLVGRELGSVTLTRSDQSMGTPQYMAPEQIRKPLAVDHRADIYSLGVVLYELLTGDLPMGNFPLPSEKVGIDVHLDEVVLRSLEREPERRYQRVSEIKSEMHSIPEPADDPKPSEGFQGFVIKRSFTGRQVAIAAAVLFVALSLIFMIRTVRQSAAKHQMALEQAQVARDRMARQLMSSAKAGADAEELAWRRQAMDQREARRLLVEAGLRPHTVLGVLLRKASPPTDPHSATGQALEFGLEKLEERYGELRRKSVWRRALVASSTPYTTLSLNPFHDGVQSLDLELRGLINKYLPEAVFSEAELRALSMELFPHGWAPMEIDFSEVPEGWKWEERIIDGHGETIWSLGGTADRLPTWLEGVPKLPMYTVGTTSYGVNGR